jgi:predicted nucleic acid-binding protein
MKVLVDSYIWLDFLRNGNHKNTLSRLLVGGCVSTNKIILAELIPPAKQINEFDLINYLSGIDLVPLNIDWDEIAEIQYQCSSQGLGKPGLLDIAIAQNAKQNGLTLFSTESHLVLLSKLMGIQCLSDDIQVL